MTKINGIEIASGFSVGGSGSNIASDIIFSPPEGMNSTNLQDAIIEAASMGGGSSSAFNPTKKSIATVTCASGIGSVYLMNTQVSTAYAKGDGSDFRVQSSDINNNPVGNFLPIAVRYVTSVSGIFTYNVSWPDTISSGQVKKYAITYGDSSADFMFMPQSQIGPLITVLNSSILGNSCAIYYDKTMAYVPSVEDWGVAGAQIAGAGDDSYVLFTPLVSPYLWNGAACTTTINVSNNGAFGFGNPPAGSGGHGAYSPDSLGWMANDLFQNWVRQVSLPDGFYIQWDGKTYNSNFPIKVTLRYIIGGRWILTWFDSSGLTAPLYMGAYINIQNFTLQLPVVPIRSDPTSYGVIVVDSNIISSVTIGAEEDI